MFLEEIVEMRITFSGILCLEISCAMIPPKETPMKMSGSVTGRFDASLAE